MKLSILLSLIIILIFSSCRENPPYDPSCLGCSIPGYKISSFTISGQIITDCGTQRGEKRTLEFYKLIMTGAQLRVSDIQTDDEGRFKFSFKDTLESPMGGPQPYYLKSIEDSTVFVFTKARSYSNLNLAIQDSVEIDVSFVLGDNKPTEKEYISYVFAYNLPSNLPGVKDLTSYEIKGPLDQDTTIHHPLTAWKVVELDFDGIPFHRVVWTKSSEIGTGTSTSTSDNFKATSSKVPCVRKIDAVEVDWRQ